MQVWLVLSKWLVRCIKWHLKWLWIGNKERNVEMEKFVCVVELLVMSREHKCVFSHMGSVMDTSWQQLSVSVSVSALLAPHNVYLVIYLLTNEIKLWLSFSHHHWDRLWYKYWLSTYTHTLNFQTGKSVCQKSVGIQQREGFQNTLSSRVVEFSGRLQPCGFSPFTSGMFWLTSFSRIMQTLWNEMCQRKYYQTDSSQKKMAYIIYFSSVKEIDWVSLNNSDLASVSLSNMWKDKMQLLLLQRVIAPKRIQRASLPDSLQSTLQLNLISLHHVWWMPFRAIILLHVKTSKALCHLLLRIQGAKSFWQFGECPPTPLF